MANYPKPTEEWITNTMKTLEVSREEALEIWMDDHDIDAGKVKPFDLDPAKQKVVKEMTKAGGKVHSGESKPRERKPNEEKRDIINFLSETLANYAKFDELNVANVEREITFKIGENCYSLTLTQHRKKKG